MATVDMATLVGKTFDFHGIDGNVFVLGAGGAVTAYEALEDDNDGYRSALDHVEVVDASKRIYFRTPVARVRVEDMERFNPYDDDTEHPFQGWRFVDVEDGHVWLVIGTDDYDDYYPCFTFRYEPKAAKP